MLHRVGSPAPELRSRLLASLIDNGLTRLVAEDLVDKYSSINIERQLKALPFRHPRNPAQCLQSSIRGEWALPAEMVRAKMTPTTSGGGSSGQWQTVESLIPDIEAALSERDDRELLEAYAYDQARTWFPNQVGNDGRDMPNLPRAINMVLAFELGLYAELQTPFATYGAQRRRFGPRAAASAPAGAASTVGDTPDGAGPVADLQTAMI